MQAPLVAQPYQRPVGGPRFYPGSHNNEPPSECGKCCFPICEIYRYDGCGGALWGAVAWAAVWGVITSPTGGWGVVCGPARYAFRCWTPEYAPVVAPPNPVMKFFCPLMEVWRYEKNPCDGGGDCEPFILPFIGQIIPCIGCCYTMLCWNPEYRDATTASSMNAATAASMPMMQQPMMMMQPMAAQSNDMGRGDLNDLGVATSNGLPFGWEERDHPSGQKQYYNSGTKELTWIKPEPTTAPAMKESMAGDLASALAGAKLLQYEHALRELGCVDAGDLADVEEEDLLEMGMKKIEAKRLMRLVQ